MQSVMPTLTGQLDELEGYLSKTANVNDSVSAWSVGQQIEHTLSALSAMSVALRRGRNEADDRRPNRFLAMVLESGTIQRGRVKAPKAMLPSELPEEKALQRLILKTRKRVSVLEELPPEASFVHHILGPMHRNEALLFMTIHTEHHLKIIRDILQEAPESA